MIEREECSGCGQEWHLMDCGGCGREVEVRYFSLPEIKALLTEDGEALDQAAAAFSAYDHSEADLPASERSGPYEYAKFMLGAAVDALADAIPSKEKRA